ncbi:MAG TPA: ABC-2 transporter permease [Usitatibacter sp.]|nr:ABC-2 transporter permease [Usitatibacter sp.]
MKALLALVRTDLRLYFSNRRALLISLVAPILIAGFFGATLGGSPGKRPARIPVAVVDLDGSDLTKAIVASMRKDDNFDLRDFELAPAIEQVRAGKLRAAVVLPRGFGAEAPRALFSPYGKKPEIEIHVDPSQTVTMALVNGLLAQHVMEEVARTAFGGGAAGAKFLAESKTAIEKSREIPPERKKDLAALFDDVERLRSQPEPGGAGEGTPDGFALRMPFETKQREVTSGDRKYNPYAHSFAGMGVQFILFSGIDLGVAVLLMRRMGLWKRLRAAPVSRRLLLGSRVLSGMLIATVMMLGIYAAGIAIFGVRVDGSWLGLLLVIAAFGFLTSSFGLLIASVGRTPEATRGIAILATLLLVMLGGAWVPTFIFPEWLQHATLFVPTRWAVDGLEAMTWRGLGLEAALPAVAVMLTFSVAFAATAVACFRWEE